MYARLRSGGNLPLCARLRCGGNLPQCLAFGTGEGPLWYGICVPCSKRLPVVRDAFSEAFGVKNRLLRYGRDIRHRKPPSTVRNRHSATKKGSWGTRRVFRGPRCMKTSSCRTGRIFRGVPCQKQPTAAPDATSVRETAPALFVRSGPFHHFLRPANAELVSGSPFPCSFDGTRY